MAIMSVWPLKPSFQIGPASDSRHRIAAGSLSSEAVDSINFRICNYFHFICSLYTPLRDAAIHTLFNMASIKGSQRPVTRPWNTKDLGKRLGVDLASAATAGALTCPLITIIDR